MTKGRGGVPAGGGMQRAHGRSHRLGSLGAFSQYSFERNGQPAMNQGGSLKSDRLTPEHVQLPCCLTCNTALNDRFELRIERPWRNSFLADRSGGSEAEEVGLWLLKTCLLLAHPAQKTGWGVNELSWSGASSPLSCDWMISGSGPPSDISLFAHRFYDDRLGVPPFKVALPELRADDHVWLCQSVQLGLRDWGMTLIHHPGWVFEHPSTTPNSVVGIWPASGPISSSSLVPQPTCPWIYTRGSLVVLDSMISTHRRA